MPALPADAFEACPDALIAVDAAGRVRGWNSAAERLYGLSFAAVHGRDLDAMVPANPPWRGATTGRIERSHPARPFRVDCQAGPFGEGTLFAVREPTERQEDYQRRLRELASELALAEERQRRELAADLHDHLGQGLAMLRMQLLRLKGDAVFCGLDAPIEGMQTLLEQAIRYTRSLTFEISPPVLHELGLEAALEWLAEQVGQKHGLDVRLRMEARVDPVPEAVRVLLFKSVRELLTNVVKHAEARTATLRIANRGGEVELAVTDDGLGFTPADHLHPHGDGTFGLFSVHERMRGLGGRVELVSALGAGTTVRLLVPRWEGGP